MPRRIIILSLAMCLAACSDPGESVFVKSGERGEDGKYRYVLDMSDSVSYSISLYSRLDCGRKEFECLPAMEMEITFETPSGRRASETVFLPKDVFVPKSFFSFESRTVYRSGLVPSEPGRWGMEVEIKNGQNYSGLRGLGVILKKKKDGKR